MEAILAFLKDPGNRDVLTWLGGGIVVVGGGLWAVVKFFAGKKARDDHAGVSITASGDRSVASGRDSNVSLGAKEAPKGKSTR